MTPHFYLVLRLRMCWATSQLLLHFFMVCTTFSSFVLHNVNGYLINVTFIHIQMHVRPFHSFAAWNNILHVTAKSVLLNRCHAIIPNLCFKQASQLERKAKYLYLLQKFSLVNSHTQMHQSMNTVQHTTNTFLKRNSKWKIAYNKHFDNM